MSSVDPELVAIECLRHAIEDTQGTIRAYDVKSEILAALITLIVTVSSHPLLGSLEGPGQNILKASWFVCLITIFILGAVLMPKSNLVDSIDKGTFVPNGTYYLHEVNKPPIQTVSAISQKALATNWIEELTYESMKLSVIRDRKHCLFITALISSGLTIGLVVIAYLAG